MSKRVRDNFYAENQVSILVFNGRKNFIRQSQFSQTKISKCIDFLKINRKRYERKLNYKVVDNLNTIFKYAFRFQIRLTVWPLELKNQRQYKVKFVAVTILNFFEGLKIKNSRFSDFSCRFHAKTYNRAKFHVSTCSRSRLELVYISQ